MEVLRLDKAECAYLFNRSVVAMLLPVGRYEFLCVVVEVGMFDAAECGCIDVYFSDVDVVDFYLRHDDVVNGIGDVFYFEQLRCAVVAA